MPESAALAAVRQQIDHVLEVGRSETPGLPTGVSALDASLQSGGIPRGRITELLGEAGSGRTTLLRRIVQTAVHDGLWVAYVDASCTLAPRDWAHLATPETSDGQHRLHVVRPHDMTRGAWCADVLLRSGAFTLVVLDGAPVLSRPVSVRLSRLARDANAAFIVTGDERSATLLGGALRMRVHPGAAAAGSGTSGFAGHYGIIGAHGIRHDIRRRQLRRGEGLLRAIRDIDPDSVDFSGTSAGEARIFHRERSFSIGIEKGGSPAVLEVRCAVRVEGRLCAHPGVPDRRGVARASRHKWNKPQSTRAAGGQNSRPKTGALHPPR